MELERFRAIVERYPQLRLAVVGDFCLDRYLEIDPARAELSIETGLPVHNVMNVRAQPGAAGTILNNLVALGIGAIYPVGFAGDDGEGYELRRALESRAGVQLGLFVKTSHRRTFTYCKPLVLAPPQPPVELNRLDVKNWTPTPSLVQGLLMQKVAEAARMVGGFVVLDQVDIPETGVVTQRLLEAIREQVQANPELLVLADSRRGLRGFPPVVFKMNAAELSALTGAKSAQSLDEVKETALALAISNRRAVFVTLSERGMVGAAPSGQVAHVPALPIRGPIDVVGAGDAVSANLTASMTAGAKLEEALEIANAAASVVLHKVGTTGTASVLEIEERLRQERRLTGDTAD